MISFPVGFKSKKPGHCPDCDEKSTTTKCYRTKVNPGLLKRVCFCTNKGCGYKVDFPPLIYSAVRQEFVMALANSQI